MESFWLNMVQINLWFQQLGDWLFVPMRFFSFLGDEEFYLIVMPAIYWCFDSRIGLKVGLLLMLSNGISSFFKFLFHTPRPFWVSQQVRPMVMETSFGAPSGHSLQAASLWGYFAYLAKKRWSRIIFIAIIFLIGISRLYVGVHFILDVLSGWLIGGLLFWVYSRCIDGCLDRVKKWSTAQQWLGAVGTTAVILILPALLKLFNAGWQIEPAYLQNIFYHFPEFELTPFSIDGVITAAAVWFGILAGTILTHRTLPLGRIQASTSQLILRFIIGTIGVAAIWMGLKLVFPDDDTLVSQVLRFVRYGFLGLWVTAAAPYLFKKIGLER